MDAVGAASLLHRKLLAWDYFELCDKSEETGGVFDKLEKVPDTFESMKVTVDGMKVHRGCVHGATAYFHDSPCLQCLWDAHAWATGTLSAVCCQHPKLQHARMDHMTLHPLCVACVLCSMRACCS